MKERWLVFVEAMLCVLVWSHAPVAIKYCLQSAEPWEFVIIRHAPAALIFAAYLALGRQRSRLVGMLNSDLWRFVGAGLLGVAGYHFVLNTGMQRIPAGAAALIIGMAPAFTFFLAAVLIGERPTWQTAGGVAIAFAGLFVCVRYGGGEQIELRYVLGALVTLLAPFFAAVYTTLSRPLAQRYGALDATAMTFVVGTLPLMLTTRPEMIAKLPSYSASFWAVAAFLGFGCTLAAYILWARVLQRLEATRAVVFLYAIPALGLVWGRLYLDERVTGWLVVGALLIVGGVVLTNRKRPREREAQARLG